MCFLFLFLYLNYTDEGDDGIIKKEIIYKIEVIGEKLGYYYSIIGQDLIENL